VREGEVRLSPRAVEAERRLSPKQRRKLTWWRSSGSPGLPAGGGVLDYHFILYDIVVFKYNVIHFRSG